VITFLDDLLQSLLEGSKCEYGDNNILAQHHNLL